MRDTFRRLGDYIDGLITNHPITFLVGAVAFIFLLVAVALLVTNRETSDGPQVFKTGALAHDSLVATRSTG